MKTIIKTIAAAALLSLGLGAMAQGKGETVRIQDYPGPGNIPVRVAIKKGLCEKVGLKCEVRPFNNGPLGVQAMLAGDVEVAYSGPEVTLQAVAKGADLRVFAGGVATQPFFLAAAAGMETPNAAKGYPAAMADFKGKKIGVPARGSHGEQMLVEMLTGAGLKAEDVTLIAIGGPATAFPALASRQVDALMIFSPADGFCEVLKACKVVVDLRKGEGPQAVRDTIGSGVPYWVKADYAAKNPHVINALRAAIVEAQAFMADPKNFKEVTDITEGYFKIDNPQGRAILEATMRQSLPMFSPELKPAAVQATANYLLATKQLQSAMDTSKLILK